MLTSVPAAMAGRVVSVSQTIASEPAFSPGTDLPVVHALGDSGGVVHIAGPLPAMPETWRELPAPSIGLGQCGHLGGEPDGRTSLCGCLSLRLSDK